MTAVPASTSLVDRMIRAAKLDEQLFEEVEHDTTANVQALTVVAIAAVAAGLGGFLAEVFEGDPGAAFVALAVGIVFTVVGWAVYAALTYWIGASFLAGPATSADWGEIARALGFAYTPFVLLILAVIPVLGGIAAIVALVWFLWATVIALRQALDFTTLRAVGTAILGWIALVVINALAQSLFIGL